MRRETIARVLIGLALCAVPSTSHAQRRRGRRGGGGAETTEPTPPPAGDSGDSGSMSFSTDEAAQSPAPTDNPTPPAEGTTDTTAGQTGDANAGAAGGIGLEGIGGADVRATRHPLTENISAVQQIYALRNRRLEIQPTVAVSLNDPYVSHTGVGVGLNFWVTNVLAIGANFLWFQGLNGRSDLDFQVARGTRFLDRSTQSAGGLVVPINEYQMAAALNFSYVPVYGKFLMFNRFIFHWDIYLMAGVGFMRTRPIPVVDPEVRSFNYDWRIMFNAGVGVRVFINRWLGIIGEIRNYVYLEQLEALDIQPVDVPVGRGQNPVPMSRQDPSTWLGNTSLTDNVMVQVGLTVYLPFGVTYRLLK
jgi:outer membrane beta-barrel protein